MKPDYSLYLVTEESIPLNELATIVEEAIKGGATLVQLREKASSGKVFYEKALHLNELLKKYDVPLIINDRVDIALAIGAAGVHVGQDDLPVAAVRKIVPQEMIVGVSVATLAEAEDAQRNGADYVGVGSVFPTQSKKDAELLLDGSLTEITSNITIPAVAIGGIQIDNIASIKNKGLAGVAVVSAIIRAHNPAKAASAFKDELNNF
ncbi:thiamine phosphate synthase [Cytobacillus purgationiresistens]|uniref:Thiamine-phosphate synthase n=1 Tax=Cytobacillus purgationiresistens TaxID=863449 RepID=A0ABU0ACG9_9BACI|nr:thiamine phosphate synthase [Cytobacillus purgationiresistens]MDQ0268492.1 thiamine-phosphate pyrophosphorylase [Cytobacillus purgationiresistens]